jgi:phosphoribosylformylglycinamidine synthase II
LNVDESLIEELSLSLEEYGWIVERLGREPNEVELGMFGAMWSEHCGYKNSKPLLRTLPNKGPRILTTMGGENAGAVDIGDGICVVMKIESHNHPSAIEPYEGAATGVGGIVRDIFAMGARPIATLDSLRFGPLTEARNRYLLSGVVGGIGGYGNCLGIPTVAGEVSFGGPYSANPLVNAMCVGLARIDHLVSGRAGKLGNIVLLVGADTGRDGIGGANVLASRVFDEGSAELRPTVQVGNPFMEKLLMEACLELAEKHPDWIDGIQDLGAAGLTSSTVESAARAEMGIEIDIAKVPRRERGMVPYEVMLSESQERMLVFPKKEHEAEVRALLEHWELKVDVIGQIVEGGNIRVLNEGKLAAELPVTMLVEPPEYRRKGVKPVYLAELQSYDLGSLPDLSGREEAGKALLRLLGSPELASKRWVWRQYDHQVLTNTVVTPGSDAAVLRVKDTKKGIALTTDGNELYSYLDPYTGGMIAIAEAARNVVCAGALPLAVTDCLNFGNPEKLDVYYQMEETIRGMGEACEKLATPIISGNVSLYNETNGEPVLPTPVAGMLGLLEDVEKWCPMGFQADGDEVLLLGASLDASVNSLSGSEYVREMHGLVVGRPEIDLDLEARVQKVCLEAIKRGLLSSAHDCSQGGLAVALAECCIAGGRGLEAAEAKTSKRLDAALFGEAQSRIIVSFRPEAAGELAALAREEEVPLSPLGRVGGKRLTLGEMVDVAAEDLTAAYEKGLPEALRG